MEQTWTVWVTNKYCKYYCVVLSSFRETDHLTHLIDLDIFTAIIQIRTAKSQETSQALEMFGTNLLSKGNIVVSLMGWGWQIIALFLQKINQHCHKCITWPTMKITPEEGNSYSSEDPTDVGLAFL